MLYSSHYNSYTTHITIGTVKHRVKFNKGFYETGRVKGDPRQWSEEDEIQALESSYYYGVDFYRHEDAVNRIKKSVKDRSAITYAMKAAVEGATRPLVDENTELLSKNARLLAELEAMKKGKAAVSKPDAFKLYEAEETVVPPENGPIVKPAKNPVAKKRVR